MKTSKSNLSFVFPGQGSQKIGMLREFSSEETVRVTFSEASEVLEKILARGAKGKIILKP